MCALLRHRFMGVPRRRISPVAILPILALLGLWGCPKHIPPPANLITSPVQLRAAIDGRVESIDSLRLKGVVTDYFDAEGRVKVRQLILVRPNDKIRVQTRLPGSDEIVNLLACSQGRCAMHNRNSNEYLHGSGSAENVSMLLPIDLSAADVVRVMSGGAPWDRFASFDGVESVSWDTRVGRYLYRSLRDDGSLTMSVRSTDFAVVEISQFDSDQKVVYRYTTDDWQVRRASGSTPSTSVALPDYRRFLWPLRQLDFSMSVGETQVGVPLSDALFELAPPPGSRVVDVDRLNR